RKSSSKASSLGVSRIWYWRNASSLSSSCGCCERPIMLWNSIVWVVTFEGKLYIRTAYFHSFLTRGVGGENGGPIPLPLVAAALASGGALPPELGHELREQLIRATCSKRRRLLCGALHHFHPTQQCRGNPPPG